MRTRHTHFLSLMTLSALALAGCSATSTEEPASETATPTVAASSSATASPTPSASAAASSPAPATSTASPSASASATASAPAQTSRANAPKSEVLGGGDQIFAHRYVALYGNPGGPSLGVLGEQGPAESVARVKNLAAEYQAHTDEKVIPAFEIITTVASSAPGPDGDYSDEATIESLRPLVDEARKNGVYVILDFQPGRSTFTEQVKQYEELLKEPHVGLGIDPEWRIYPGQVHLQQIGTVDASEINKTLDYLAALTDKHRLPQKMVVLHQFTHSMITNRAALDTSHPELALTLHADGHGTPELKNSTYQELIRDLDPAIKPSWKNFYDEDTPTLTPAQTYALTPKPYVVTYQ
ncbi:sugar phosphate isomerase/epimerase [Rothia nasimurium]|uniref:sugar phosphate isomerase/epimerase n=1 Tax=Rothia nasimurium TaxID=85336 RepID=UPI001F2A13B5|nr:sugar phosphate isomerase/epimerase [Rothia nasimurium]